MEPSGYRVAFGRRLNYSGPFIDKCLFGFSKLLPVNFGHLCIFLRIFLVHSNFQIYWKKIIQNIPSLIKLPRGSLTLQLEDYIIYNYFKELTFGIVHFYWRLLT